MKVVVGKYSGFCFGVKRAIDVAKETLATAFHPVYLVGEIVHNKVVVKDLEASGLKRADDLASIPSGSIIILKAHGSPPETYEKAKELGLEIIDATCPMVTDIHREAKRLEDQGYQVIVFGDKNHEEVIGICGYVKDPIIIAPHEDIEPIRFRSRVAVVCQSTQKIDEMLFVNTTCQTTRQRQREIKELAKTCDKVVIVGSRNSANTKHLYEEAVAINAQTVWIETAEDLDRTFFSTDDSVAVMSGASTPHEIINQIEQTLNSFFN